MSHYRVRTWSLWLFWSHGWWWGLHITDQVLLCRSCGGRDGVLWNHPLHPFSSLWCQLDLEQTTKHQQKSKKYPQMKLQKGPPKYNILQKYPLINHHKRPLKDPKSSTKINTKKHDLTQLPKNKFTIHYFPDWFCVSKFPTEQQLQLQYMSNWHFSNAFDLFYVGAARGLTEMQIGYLLRYCQRTIWLNFVLQ